MYSYNTISSYTDEENDNIEYVPENETIENIAKLYSNLSDSTRLKILFLLTIKSCSVNEIVYKLKMNQSTVSHQLRILKDANLVYCVRDNKNVIYHIKDTKINDVLLNTVIFLGY